MNSGDSRIGSATPEVLGQSTERQLPERLLRLNEVKRRVGLGKSMIYRLISTGKFPAPYKLSPSASRWSEREITSWIDDVKDGYEGKKRRV